MNKLSGGTKVNVFITICILVLIGFVVARGSQPYLLNLKYENVMSQHMRVLVKSNEDDMIADLIQEAQKLGLGPLTRDDFYFEGGPGKPSVMRVKWVAKIQLWDDKWYLQPMTAEKELNIPYEIPP
jgi:hypothetical protein